MTSWPFSLASSAMPTTDPLTPELEAMRKMSPVWIGEISHNSATMSGVAFEPRSSKGIHRQAAAQYDVAESDLVRWDEATGPARDLHRERLRMSRPERLNHCTGLDSPSSDRSLRQGLHRRPDGQPLESCAHLAGEVTRDGRNDALRHRSAPSPGVRPEPVGMRPEPPRICPEPVEGRGCTLALFPSRDAPAPGRIGSETGALGGVRRGRRWEDTACADAASLALDRSKFSCATSR